MIRHTRRFIRKHRLQCQLLTALLWLACGGQSPAATVQGDIDMPGQWVVYAPFDRFDELADERDLGSIPDALTVRSVTDGAERSAQADIFDVKPGKPVSLADYFDEQQVGNAAYVFLEINSSQDQEVTLGVGADWWLQAWLNGELVFDTLSNDKGNQHGCVDFTNHTLTVPLRSGTNTLALRFVTGRASAMLAVGGPREIAAALEAQAAEESLNELPERFEDRLVFPQDVQALATARRGLQLPETDADLAAGAVAGVQPMPARQVFAEGNNRNADISDTLHPRFDEPVRLRLAKSVYPWEDRHLDAIVWTTPEDAGEVPAGEVDVILRDAQGAELSRHTLTDLSASGLFFSMGLPPALEGSEGTLEVVWRAGGEVLGSVESAFQVEQSSDVKRAGRVPLQILNEVGASIDNAPMSVGVPFPRGALDDPDAVRLLDEAGNELALQTQVTARWSRFGPVKWLLCDFSVDLAGESRQLWLEYGPSVRREEVADIAVDTDTGDGFPGVDAGRLRVVDGGVQFDAAGDGEFRQVLAPEALAGAFVQHADGGTYTVAEEAEHAVEQIGPTKALIRSTGWYVDAATGERFCQFVTRLAFFRDSPVARIQHTWIFTGDGNRDRIADMGWRFDVAGELRNGRILSAFEDGAWLDSSSLVQVDYRRYLLPATGEEIDGRTPGVLSLTAGDSRVSLGAVDFWQNFPSELEIDDGGFTFYNWPRHNPPARFERPVELDDAFRLRFAHEGKALNFRLPDAFAENPIWREATGNGSRNETHWNHREPETANAQGIAQTEDMVLYFTPADREEDAVVPVMKGFNDETLRAVADPQWVTASGVFGEVPPYDPQRYPEVEEAFESMVKAPRGWVERLGFYGMWVHGDYPTWNLNLGERTVSNYRTLRKAHHDYPLKWLPFARSGDPEHLKLAATATRQMADANFSHYASAEVDEAVGPDHFRQQGWWDRSLVPWAGRFGTTTRNYAVDSDYLWHAWHMTGDARARDVALLFGELTQHSHGTATRGRGSQSVLVSYLDMYQATFDPWFINAAHEIARVHRRRFGGEVVDRLTLSPRGPARRREDWRLADNVFYEFTGSEAHEPIARNSAIAFAGHLYRVQRAIYRGDGGGSWDVPAAAWRRTGDRYYLGRLAADLDYAKNAIPRAEDVPYIPPIDSHGFAQTEIVRTLPTAMAALAELDSMPEPIHNPMQIAGTYLNRGEDDQEAVEFRLPEVIVRSKEETPVQLTFHAKSQNRGSFERTLNYTISGPGDTELNSSLSAPASIELPPESGAYRIRLAGRVPYPTPDTDPDWLYRRVGTWYFPLAGRNVAEVLHFDGDDDGTQTQTNAQGLWFQVPEGVREFWVQFGSGNRLSVWNADGERVWDHSMLRNDTPPGKVTIDVLADQAGRLWRATGASFTIDPRIPPYFSITRSKWFDPNAAGR